MRLLCSQCDGVTAVNAFAFKTRRKSGLPYTCHHCPADLYKTGSKPKTGKTDSQKRSQRQEKRSAKRIGGDVQPASGAGSSKGDVRKAFDTRMECKLTRARSFSLKLSELEKIEQEAGSEKPVFEIEFQGVYPHKRYVVIPGWLYDQLTGDQ